MDNHDGIKFIDEQIRIKTELIHELARVHAETLKQFKKETKNISLKMGLETSKLHKLSEVRSLIENKPGSRETINAIESLSHINISSKVLHSLKARLYFLRNDTSLSLFHAREAWKCDTSDTVSIFNLGLAHHRLGNFSEAAKLYGEVLQKDVNDIHAANNLIEIYINLASYNTALELTLKYDQSLPKHPQTLARKAKLYFLTDQIDYAKDLYQELIQKYQEEDEILYAYAILMSAINQDDEALKLLKSSIEKRVPNSKKDEIIHQISQIYRLKGKIDTATKHLTELKKGAKKVRKSPTKIITLEPFGRSGSLFLHSLFDGHRQISTVPGAYLRGWFTDEVWNKLNPRGSKEKSVKEIVKRFVNLYEPIFDAASKKNVPGKPFGDSDWLARDSGFCGMGEQKNISTKLDINIFKKRFEVELDNAPNYDRYSTFLSLHKAFDATYRKEKSVGFSPIIFYHQHIDSPEEEYRIRRYFSDVKKIIIFREPVQSFLSWSNPDLQGADPMRSYRRISLKLENLLVSSLQLYPVTALRLEKLKQNPDTYMRNVCKHIGIEYSPSLLDASFLNVKFWGPTSVQHMTNPWDREHLEQNIESHFENRFVNILEILFRQLHAHLRYSQSYDAHQHQNDIKKINDLAAEPFNFEDTCSKYCRSGDVKNSFDYKKLRGLFSKYSSILLSDEDPYRNIKVI